MKKISLLFSILLSLVIFEGLSLKAPQVVNAWPACPSNDPKFNLMMFPGGCTFQGCPYSDTCIPVDDSYCGNGPYCGTNQEYVGCQVCSSYSPCTAWVEPVCQNIPPTPTSTPPPTPDADLQPSINCPSTVQAGQPFTIGSNVVEYTGLYSNWTVTAIKGSWESSVDGQWETSGYPATKSWPTTGHIASGTYTINTPGTYQATVWANWANPNVVGGGGPYVNESNYGNNTATCTIVVPAIITPTPTNTPIPTIPQDTPVPTLTPTPSFNFIPSCTNVSVAAPGDSATSIVSLSNVTGPPEQVVMDNPPGISPAAPGVSFGWNPTNACTPNCAIGLSLFTSTTTPTGNYTFSLIARTPDGTPAAKPFSCTLSIPALPPTDTPVPTATNTPPPPTPTATLPPGSTATPIPTRTPTPTIAPPTSTPPPGSFSMSVTTACTVSNTPYVSVSWSSLANTAYYDIMRSSNGGATFDYIGSKFGAASGVFIDPDDNAFEPPPLSGATYYYGVIAYDSSNIPTNSTPASRAVQVASCVAPTATPTPTPTTGAPTPTPTAAPASWFQTKDGDVHSGGSISQPANPGPNADWVVTTGGTLSNFRSSNNWQVSGYNAIPKTYDYTYFNNKFTNPTMITSNSIDDGASPTDRATYKTPSGQTVLSGASFGNFVNKTVVILVDGDLNINSDFNPGGSAVAFIVKGKITIASSVSTIRAILVADGTISTGIGGLPLTGTGTWISYGGFNLQRTAGGVGASEQINYNLQMLSKLNDILGSATFNWQEVAP